jgi:hypothetical protein
MGLHELAEVAAEAQGKPAALEMYKNQGLISIDALERASEPTQENGRASMCTMHNAG